MHYRRAVIICGLTTIGTVPKLVADHEIARFDVRLEAAGGVWPQNPGHADRGERPDVGAIVDLVGRVAVAGAMPGQERHPLALVGADRQGAARRAVRRLDGVV